jgi:hypothetical protein
VAGEPLIEGSRALSAFVSSTHVEFRALVAGARAVATLSTHRPVSAVHIRGDAAAVIDTVDPTRPTAPGDAIRRRRVASVRDALADTGRGRFRRHSDPGRQLLGCGRRRFSALTRVRGEQRIRRVGRTLYAVCRD